MGLVVALAQLTWVHAVGIGRVHRCADRETSDEPATRDAIDHGELFGHARGRVVERQAVAEDADGRVGRAPRQRGGHEIGRWHQAVAIRVMLVAADGIEAALGGVFELVEELVVHAVCPFGIEQRGMNIDPHRRVLLAKIVGQLLIGHQMEPQEFHGEAPPVQAAGTARQYGPRAAGIQGTHIWLDCSVLIAGEKRIIVSRADRRTSGDGGSGMELAYSEHYQALQGEVCAFIAKYGHLSPNPGGGRQRPSKKALDWQKLLLEHGYFARNIPREYGGFGLPLDVLELAVIAEEIAKGGVYPGIMNQGISMLVPTLLEVGTKEQCAQWIERTIRGEVIWCQGYSEPGSGSDLAAARTR